MAVPLIAAVPVVWTWLTTTSAGVLAGSSVLVTSVIGLTGKYIEYSKEQDFINDYDEGELKYREEEFAQATSAVNIAVDEVVNTFDSSTVNPADYVPQIVEDSVKIPEIAIELTGVSMLEIMAESNALKQKDLELKEAQLLAMQEQNRKLVNQNEILYKLTMESMESNKYSAARLVLDKAHTPVISKALVEQAVQVKQQNKAIKVQEQINDTYTTYTQAPAATVNVTNEVATPVVNVASPTVNNTVDTTPIADQIGTVNTHLSTVAANALKQKEIAEWQTTSRTVLDSDLQPLATGTPLEINVARQAAIAKNETDEAEFELDDDLLDDIAGAFSIPTMDKHDETELKTFLEGRIS